MVQAVDMGSLKQSLKSLGPLRIAAIAAVGLVVLGFLLFLTLRGSQRPMALLYGDLDLRDSGQVVAQLDTLKIPYQLRGDGTQIMVAADQVASARLALARQGLPSGGSLGYELFDRGESLGTSQFQQQMNLARALEGELSRSIRTISAVRAARVHLVLPRREPFAREQQEAQASVVLTLAGVTRLDKDQTRAIVNLLVAAVPNLKAQHISIIDSRGEVLADGGRAVDGGSAATTQDEAKRAAESRMARSVETLLERTLGPGNVRVEASLEYDQSRVNETQEQFDPDGQVLRSQHSTSESNRTNEAQGAVTVQNNLPNPNPGNAASNAGTQENRQDETNNYEISRTVRSIVRDQPVLKRLSMAILVNGVTEPGPDGNPVWRERTPAEITQISSLVRSAVGYDESRGDKVEVTSMRFAQAAPADDAAAGNGLMGLPLERGDMMRLIEAGGGVVLFLVFVLFFARPALTRLTTMRGGEIGQTAEQILAGLGDGSASAALGSASAAMALTSDPEDMVSMAQVEGQVRAASLRKLADLVEQRPGESAAALRVWLAGDRA